MFHVKHVVAFLVQRYVCALPGYRVRAGTTWIAVHVAPGSLIRAAPRVR